MMLILAQAVPETTLPLLIFVVALIAVVVLSIIGRYISLWFQAFVSGAPISLLSIVGMSLRKIPPRVIVEAYINAHKAGLKEIRSADLETHYLAGGDIIAVVAALIAAKKANITLDWQRATAIDLAGRDILDAVKTSVNPKVIDCPDVSHGDYITGVSKDGVQLKCRARVTVRTNIAQLVGGAGEETIVARVGEGIIGALGAAETHLVVLENPELITKKVLDRGLDNNTAFEILSIDIADIDVDKNIGAELRAAEAESKKRVAQAKAEERRAMAVALEQEMKAEVCRKQALLVEAQAEVPKGLADALRQGKLGVMDYYRMENVRADTKMRQEIAGEESSK